MDELQGISRHFHMLQLQRQRFRDLYDFHALYIWENADFSVLAPEAKLRFPPRGGSCRRLLLLLLMFLLLLLLLRQRGVTAPRPTEV